MLNNNIWLVVLLYITGTTIGWFQTNLQFINDYWKDKHHVLILISSFPISYSMFYAWKIIVESTGSIWSARFLFFALSYLVFPTLTYLFMGESPFTLKTSLCILLSILIILIQAYL